MYFEYAAKLQAICRCVVGSIRHISEQNICSVQSNKLFCFIFQAKLYLFRPKDKMESKSVDFCFQPNRNYRSANKQNGNGDKISSTEFINTLSTLDLKFLQPILTERAFQYPQCESFTDCKKLEGNKIKRNNLDLDIEMESCKLVSFHKSFNILSLIKKIYI